MPSKYIGTKKSGLQSFGEDFEKAVFSPQFFSNSGRLRKMENIEIINNICILFGNVLLFPTCLVDGMISYHLCTLTHIMKHHRIFER